MAWKAPRGRLTASGTVRPTQGGELVGLAFRDAPVLVAAGAPETVDLGHDQAARPLGLDLGQGGAQTGARVPPATAQARGHRRPLSEVAEDVAGGPVAIGEVVPTGPT